MDSQDDVGLDLTACEESEVPDRLDRQIPSLITSGTRSRIIDLSTCQHLHRRTLEALDLAHRELRTSGGRLAVVASKPGRTAVSYPDGLVMAPSLDSARGMLGHATHGLDQ